MNNEPVAWLLFRDGGESYPEYTNSYKQMREWETYLGDNERIEPHYTHPAKTLTDEEILSKFMTAWKDFLMVEQGTNGVMNVQMVALHFYKLGLNHENL